MNSGALRTRSLIGFVSVHDKQSYEETRADKAAGNPCFAQASFLSEKLRIWVQTSKQLSRRCDADGVFALSAVGALVVRKRFKFRTQKAISSTTSVD